MQKNKTVKREMMEFGLIMAAMIPFVFYMGLPWLFSYARPVWPVYVGGCFLLLGLLCPKILLPIHGIWMKVGHTLGAINSTIILGLVFFLLFWPIGIILRLLGKDPMERSLDHRKSSYRIDPEQLSEPKEHMARPF